MKNSVIVFLNNFSTILRNKRDKEKLSQQELAFKLGVSLRTYQRLESGESEPSLSQVYKLAKILNFNVSEIFQFEDKMSEETKILSESSHELKQLAKLTSTGGWNLDIQTNIFTCSSVINDILEINIGDVIKLEDIWPYFSPGASVEIAKKTLQDCFVESRPFQLEVKLLSSSGKEKYCIISGIPEVCENKVVRIYGAFQDITKSKLIQIQLQEAMDEIHTIQSFAGFGYWKLEMLTNQLYWSKSLPDLFEIDSSTAPKTYEEFLTLVHPEDQENVHLRFSEALVLNRSYEVEHRVFTRDKKEKWLLEKCFIDLDKNHQPIKVFGYTLDITKYKFKT